MKSQFLLVFQERFLQHLTQLKKIVIAKRVQFPLKACYGITIHKSQGMTLPELVVDCENCVQPGQLGVAVGRAVSVEGLKVVNFKKKTPMQKASFICV